MSKEEAKREETREQQSQVHHEQEIDKKPSATASSSQPHSHSQPSQPYSQNPPQVTTIPSSSTSTTPTTPNPNPSSTTTRPQTTTTTTNPTTTETLPLQLPERQVIAVSASKNPAAFFNLARRFLVTDEFCDLSALEGAIVSAVDAAHLLERSKLANIVRIQTSYVTVEPRKKHAPPQLETVGEAGATTATPPPQPPHYQQQSHTHTHHQHQKQHKQYQQSQTTSGDKKPHHGKKGNPLRRSRIIITVQRTEDYKTWLEENDGVDDDNDHTGPSLS